MYLADLEVDRSTPIVAIPLQTEGCLSAWRRGCQGDDVYLAILWTEDSKDIYVLGLA